MICVEKMLLEVIEVFYATTNCWLLV